MRLIDADALEQEFCNGCQYENNKYANCIDCAVANAPTVDAVSMEEYRKVKFFNAEGIFDVFFPIKLNLDAVNRIQIGDKKFVSVVQCGQCKHFGTPKCTSDDTDWFCADGERKD